MRRFVSSLLFLLLVFQSSVGGEHSPPAHLSFSLLHQPEAFSIDGVGVVEHILAHHSRFFRRVEHEHLVGDKVAEALYLFSGVSLEGTVPMVEPNMCALVGKSPLVAANRHPVEHVDVMVLPSAIVTGDGQADDRVERMLHQADKLMPVDDGYVQVALRQVHPERGHIVFHLAQEKLWAKLVGGKNDIAWRADDHVRGTILNFGVGLS